MNEAISKKSMRELLYLKFLEISAVFHFVCGLAMTSLSSMEIMGLFNEDIEDVQAQYLYQVVLCVGLFLALWTTFGGIIYMIRSISFKLDMWNIWCHIDLPLSCSLDNFWGNHIYDPIYQFKLDMWNIWCHIDLPLLLYFLCQPCHQGIG